MNNTVKILEIWDYYLCEQFGIELSKIFANFFPVIKKHGHIVVNVPDYWMDNKRIPLHIIVIDALKKAGL